jgi:ATP-dependent 26S proteasome regulatory subunit
LNVGDGLITVKGKKLVFSTNLPSVNDVDPALIRPGRCFDIVSFRNYTKKEAKALAKKLNIDLKADKEEYSLAEIFHEQTYVKPTKTVGFI